MRKPWESRLGKVSCAVGIVVLIGGGLAISRPRWRTTFIRNVLVLRTAISPATVLAAVVNPWTASETVEPAELVKELKNRKADDRPVVVCVSPSVMYKSAHIPGAIYHGPASSEEGLNSLKKWARTMPRSADIVIYCGCCPMQHCPNIRPAFRTLRSMGFTHVRVLILQTNFYTNWFAKGYPVEKGK